MSLPPIQRISIGQSSQNEILPRSPKYMYGIETPMLLVHAGGIGHTKPDPTTEQIDKILLADPTDIRDLLFSYFVTNTIMAHLIINLAKVPRQKQKHESHWLS